MNKKTLLIIICMIFFSLTLKQVLYAKSVGKILTIIGEVDITKANTGRRIIPDEGAYINEGDKIRTGKKSFVSILFNDGTKIYLREVTVFVIKKIKEKNENAPSKFQILTGKLRAIVKKTLKQNSVVIYTPTTIAGVRGTDFGIITSMYETKIVVFEGKVQVANIDDRILKSYVLSDREETRILKNQPPTKPVKVPIYVLKKWFDMYEIDEQNNRIKRKYKEEGIIDKLLRKKEF